MRPLQLDFAPARLWRTLARTSALTWAILVLGLVALLYVADALHQTTLAQRLVDQMLVDEHARRTRHAQAAPLAVVALSTAQIVGLNGVIDQLNVPWRDLLAALESATPPAIALLSLEPDPRRRTLVCSAEARDSEAMIDYLAALQQQPIFTAVMLLRHATDQQDARKPLRFQFEASWSEVLP